MAEPQHVLRLDDADDGFRATLEDGSVIAARNVGPGPRHGAAPPGRRPSWSPCCPRERGGTPATRWTSPRPRDRRYLLVGGRQSAFEWAALLAEAGARQVDVVHRHDSPAFAAADWTWVTPMVDRLATDPGWFSRLSPAEQEGLGSGSGPRVG